jgi:hypothetical protein
MNHFTRLKPHNSLRFLIGIAFIAKLLVFHFVVPLIGGVLVVREWRWFVTKIIDDTFFLFNFHDALVERSIWISVEISFVGYHANYFRFLRKKNSWLEFKERIYILGTEDKNLWLT